MITSISMESFRGIRSGTLEPLAGLTILTGPNGCGKSSILDALLIGISRQPSGLIQAVERHPATTDGPRWLISSGAEFAKIMVGTSQADGVCGLVFQGNGTSSSIKYSEPDAENEYRELYTVGFKLGEALQEGFVEKNPKIHLIDPGIPKALDKAYSEVVRQGRKKIVLEFLQDLVPDLENLEILTEASGTPALYIVLEDKGIPVSLGGDGIQSFLQLALEVSAGHELILVEEPETYQHPRAIRQSARVLLTALRRGLQLVVTTHSLELIDAVVDEATDDDLANIALFNLLLEKGELKSSRFAGPEIAFARETLENDLR